ncbi:MAG: hypothetical protein E7261_02930 [Lachnospiraceae bacterium]|nr:hypothetical protein [Lachnospiraceae bacterium]
MYYYNRDDFLTIQEENDRDVEYFKEFYPQNMRQLQDIIEDECDQLEYQGSRMFDEYPDRNMLRSLSHKIYDRAKVMWGIEDERGVSLQSGESTSAMQRPPFGPGPQRPPFGPGTQRPPYRPPQRPNQNNLLEDVIQVLLFNELARRRCRYRNCRYNIF